MKKIYIAPTIEVEEFEELCTLTPSTNNVVVESPIPEDHPTDTPKVEEEDGDGGDVGSKGGFFWFDLGSHWGK